MSEWRSRLLIVLPLAFAPACSGATEVPPTSATGVASSSAVDEPPPAVKPTDPPVEDSPGLWKYCRSGAPRSEFSGKIVCADRSLGGIRELARQLTMVRELSKEGIVEAEGLEDVGFLTGLAKTDLLGALGPPSSCDGADATSVSVWLTEEQAARCKVGGWFIYHFAGHQPDLQHVLGGGPYLEIRFSEDDLVATAQFRLEQ